MKKSYKIIRLIKIPKLFLIIVGLFIITSCDKDDDQNPIDKLPPITQKGAQTFGCLINGQPFIPPVFGRNSPRAFYQFVRGAYTLGISAKKGGGEELQTLIIGALDIETLETGSYELKSEDSSNFFAKYLLGGGIVQTSVTTNNNPGKLIISKHDKENYIISGTFSFNIKDNNGNDIKVTDGRFDLNYTN